MNNEITAIQAFISVAANEISAFNCTIVRNYFIFHLQLKNVLEKFVSLLSRGSLPRISM